MIGRDDGGDEVPVVVPPETLSPEALRGVVEAFVLKEGTDYGERETPHEEKVREVLAQLDRGDARIVYDPRSEAVEIVSPDALAAARRAGP